MTASFRRKSFEGIAVPAGFATADVAFVDCKFERCRTPAGLLDAPPSGPSFVTLERAKFERTKSSVQQIGLVILRDVTIDDWHTGREPVFVRNCLFDRVTLRGFIGDALVQTDWNAVGNAELDVALDFYDSVDWALDIRDAKFGSFTLTGVPGDKVRFDPKRHCRVLVDALRTNDGWRDFPEALVRTIEHWCKLPTDSFVSIAGERSKYCENWKREHALLRKHGFGE